MNKIYLLAIILWACSCKQTSNAPDTNPPTDTTERATAKIDREETKKLLRELVNLENSIQAALGISQIVTQRSEDAASKQLAATISRGSDSVLQAISALSAQATIALPENRNTKTRSVEQAFRTMPAAELTTTYADWSAKYAQSLRSSHKSIARSSILDKEQLLQALNSYAAAITSAL